MQEAQGRGGAVQRSSASQFEAIAKRDRDRQLYRETHVSRRARRFISVSGNQKGSGK